MDASEPDGLGDGHGRDGAQDHQRGEREGHTHAAAPERTGPLRRILLSVGDASLGVWRLGRADKTGRPVPANAGRDAIGLLYQGHADHTSR